jgi:acetyltransferase-like isoleucine patch superfamily enzyme
MRPRASIVIPAHDEAAVLGANLERMLHQATPGEFDVVVVCNGCSDDTADVARAFPGVRVVETPVGSKVGALNLGDSATEVFPRVYLDADVEVDTASLRAVVRVLEEGAPVAAPLPRLDLGGCGPGARLYFTFWRHLGYTRKHLVGSGFYALSAEGRARFGAFPDLVADDLYVYSLFAAGERVNPPGARFVIRPPRSVRGTLDRRTRIVFGNLQLRAATGLSPDVPSPRPPQVVARRPWLVPAAAVYVVVNTVAARRAQARLAAGGTVGWNRDESRRVRNMSGKNAVTRGLVSAGTVKGWAKVANFFRYDSKELARAALGPGVYVSPTVSVRNGARVSIGAGSHIGQWSCLWAGDSSGRIEIGEHALLAPDVFITASDYDFDAGPGPVMDLPKREHDVRIGSNSWLGAKVVVVAGVTVGDGAIVAAGSVVTRDIPENAVAAGVPARVVRMRGEPRDSDR